jgi:hypothetical protein
VKRIVLSLIVVLCAGIGIASAQDPAQAPPGQPPQGQPAGPPGIADNMTPGEIQRLFDAYQIMEAQQFLTLTDQQYPQFIVRLRALQETRRKNQQQRQQLMNELQRMTNPRLNARPEDAPLKERLTALQELETRNAAEMRKAYSAMDEVLDLRQQARFRVFEEQIERRKIELLMRARQQNRPNQAPPKRPQPPPAE